MKLENELYDIYLHMHVPFWQRPYFYKSIIISAAILIGGILGYLLWRWRKKSNPYKDALKDLEQLQKRPDQTQADLQARYFELTFILKHFLSTLYKFPYQSCTDQEMLAQLPQNILTNEHSSSLSNLINAANEVKYAQEHMRNADVLLQQIAIVKNFILHAMHSNSKTS